MTQKLLNRLQAWAESSGWQVTAQPDKSGPSGTLVLETELDGEWVALALRVNDDGARVTVYSLLDDEVPEDRRTQVGELVLRANRGLLAGAFELGLDDGDLRFRTNIDLTDVELSDEQLDALMTPVLRDNLWTFDSYLGAIAETIDDAKSPADAVRDAESAAGR